MSRPLHFSLTFPFQEHLSISSFEQDSSQRFLSTGSFAKESVRGFVFEPRLRKGKDENER